MAAGVDRCSERLLAGWSVKGGGAGGRVGRGEARSGGGVMASGVESARGVVGGVGRRLRQQLCRAGAYRKPSVRDSNFFHWLVAAVFVPGDDSDVFLRLHSR